MRISLLTLLLLFTMSQLQAQKIIEQYTPLKDSLRIGPGKSDFLPCTEKGYTLVLPSQTDSVQGVLISFEDRRFDLAKDSSQQIYREATAHGLAVLYVSTGIPVDLYFSQMSLRYVDSTIRQVFATHRLPNQNIFLLGVNLSGHRALNYLRYCRNRPSGFQPQVKGIVLCDGVLDWVRQWYEETKAVRDKFAESSVFEGRLITYLLEKNLKATPRTNLNKYLDFSAYSYFDEQNRNLSYFKDYSVRAYTEPATHYWMNVKGKTTFDTNFPDMVGIINELKLTGNKKSELIMLHQPESNKDRRNPNYTWGLVDKKELIQWMVAQLQPR
jgi:hypothetical protein